MLGPERDIRGVPVTCAFCADDAVTLNVCLMHRRQLLIRSPKLWVALTCLRLAHALNGVAHHMAMWAARSIR